MSDDIARLQAILAEREREIEYLRSKINENFTNEKLKNSDSNTVSLTQEEIKRYSRQLIIPEIGIDGQVCLKKSKVLIVGAGGLGCPVGMYLTAAGVGTIGIVDYDIIDINNLHRQISHSEQNVGQDKCVSFAQAMKTINSLVCVNVHSLLLNSSNIEDIVKLYDVIVDASDNVPTRYLLNDAAVLFKKPLVSGSALKLEGQLTVYNFNGGPCYRCLFPNPPPLEAVSSCSDGGVLGSVTGVIGSLQSLEVIKIIVGLQPSYYKKMLVFDGLSGDIRIFKLRSKMTDCEICGDNPIITKLIDYELFCNAKANDKDTDISLLSKAERISCTEYKNILDSGISHLLIDVRPETEIKICSLPNSFNIPINKLNEEISLKVLKDLIQKANSQTHYVICRRGNNSQKAVKILQEHFNNCMWFDIIGGLYAWHDEIDDSLPLY